MAPIIRIFLRYLAMWLVAKGIFEPTDAKALVADQELIAQLEVLVGLVIGVGTETYYALARRFGWSK